MRTYLFVCLLLTALTSTRAQANSYHVSAGEHSSYSRIVFSKGAADAKIEQIGRSVKIRGVDSAQLYNLEDINNRRKAHRVLSGKVSKTREESYIEFTLTCDCEAQSRVLENGKLVVDIYDKTIGDLVPIATNQPTADPTVKSGNSSINKQSKLSEEDALSVEEAHNRMVALLHQASIDGLVSIRDLDSNQDEVEEIQSLDGGYKSKQPIAPSSHLLPPEIGEKSSPSLAISTDEVTLNKGPNSTTSTPAPIRYYKCFSNADFYIGEPAQKTLTKEDETDGSPLVRITDLQAQLADAELPESALLATKLAAEYLSIGFGDEAVSVLSSYGAQDTLFADMGRILANRPLNQNSQLLRAADCTGAHALWQAAAKPPRDALQLLKQTRGAIHDLPPITKGIIATRLATKMIEVEDWESAKEYFGIASDTPEADTPDLNFIAAKLLEHEGDIEGAKQAFLDISSENSTASKNALLALANAYERNEAEVHPGFINDIGALAKTDGDLYSILSEALAWAKIGNIEAAILLLRQEARNSPENLPAIRSTARKILIDVFEADNGVTYIAALEALMQNDQLLPLEAEEEEFIRLVAKRSSDLGLPNLAYDLLSDTNDSSTDFLYQKAAAAAAADNPTKAIEIAAPHAQIQKFRALIAKTQIDNNQYFEAMATAASIPDANQRAKIIAQAAWRARDWNSAINAFAAIDPSTMTEMTALQYAFAAHRAGEASLPTVVELVVGNKNDILLSNLKQLFTKPPEGSVLSRTQSVTEQISDEIKLFREALNDG